MTAIALTLGIAAGCSSSGQNASTTTTSTSAPQTTTSPTSTTSKTTTTTSKTTTTTSGGTGPKIVSFTITPKVTCASGATSTDAAAKWKTSNADNVSYTVDGEAPGAQAGLPASGSGNFRIVCQGNTHTVVFTAYGADGKSTSKTVTVMQQ